MTRVFAMTGQNQTETARVTGMNWRTVGRLIRSGAAGEVVEGAGREGGEGEGAEGEEPEEQEEGETEGEEPEE